MSLTLTEHKLLKYSKVIPSDLSEDNEALHKALLDDFSFLKDFKPRKFFKNQTASFLFSENENEYSIQADYLIGVDWLLPQKRYVQVFPKLNQEISVVFDELTDLDFDVELPTFDQQIESRVFKSESNKQIEVDYLSMLMTIAGDSYFDPYLEDLFYIDYDSFPIQLNSKQDSLTPLLVVRYLQLVKRIVQKGLKKSYYKVQKNLKNKIKGKILVGQHIRNNIFKNRFTETYCEYQVFGENNSENRFLKMVLRFVSTYIDEHQKLFHSSIDELKHTLHYINPVFELVDLDFNIDGVKNLKYNPFYGEYKEAIKIGKLLLERFAYNITLAQNRDFVMTSPFWINMPALFEMYICAIMRKANMNKLDTIKFQFSTYGNALDILITDNQYSMVIDAKYKMHYQKGQIHDDIRQVSGYARLRKVRRALNISEDSDYIIDCLIIYPDMENGIENLTFENINQYKQAIPAYHKVWKLGVKLPFIG